jgi:hypothetical protein
MTKAIPTPSEHDPERRLTINERHMLAETAIQLRAVFVEALNAIEDLRNAETVGAAQRAAIRLEAIEDRI